MAHRIWRWFADHWVLALGLLVLPTCSLPIGVVVAMSFNRAAEPRLLRTTCRTTSSRWTTGGIRAPPPDMCDALARSIADRLLATRGRHGARHADGVRAGPAPLPRARSATNLLIFLPMATPEIVMGSSLLALFVARRGAAGLLDHRHRARDVLPVVRGGDGQGPAGRAGPAAGGGRHGPLRQRVADLPAGDPAAGRCPASSRPRCCPSRCRSTTSSSRTSTPAARSRSRCTSGAPRSAASRRRST